jgi:RNA-directed DNA polymerase
MKSYRHLYPQVCSYENLKLAFQKARKRKTLKDYVIEFESNLENNLRQLESELKAFAYSPRPPTVFLVRDPKTRKISASHFRDRVVHHALCNVIMPIFEKDFIFDSFANRKGKGTHNAIRRLERFMRAVSFCKPKAEKEPSDEESVCCGYALKADILHYFATVEHEILLEMISRKIKDPDIMQLVRMILANHKAEVHGKGMPLGNLTSQFFANLYLNGFDHFAKERLGARYYIRYVDDFVILHRDRKMLEMWNAEISEFLAYRLKIRLHPEKSSIIPLERGIAFLGFRIFHGYRLLKKSNARRIWERLDMFKRKCDKGEMNREEIVKSLEGWLAYARFANSYNFRKRVVERFNRLFAKELAV